MAYNGPTIAVPESSPSSVSGQSPRDTPATKLTHVSPHGTLPLPKPIPSAHDASQPPYFQLQAYQGGSSLGRPAHNLPIAVEQDPFMINLSSEDRQAQEEKRKLSATATVFQPRGPSTPSFDTNAQLVVRAPADGLAVANATGTARLGLFEGTHRGLQPYEHRPSVPSSSASPLPLQLYFVAGPSRYIMVASFPKQGPRVYLDALLAVPVIAQSRIAVSDHIVQSGMVLLRYDDMRFAEMALARINSAFPTWASGFVTPQCWISFAGETSNPPATDSEGQVLITVSAPEGNRHISLAGEADNFAAAMHARMSVYGDVRSFSCMLATAAVVVLKFEFHSLAAADVPGLEHQSPPFQGLRISVIRSGTAHPAFRTHGPGTPTELALLQDTARFMQLPTGLGPVQAYSPGTDRLTMSNSLTRTPRKWVSPTPRTLDAPPANHNVVDIERIRRGQDVRTTVRAAKIRTVAEADSFKIMLRNIPNKVDQPMLKEIVDETSRGRYDFMYLRIDFANNCNVGYAFINFEDSQYIIDFVEAVAGKRWNRFNSDKVAEVSYATIQGKDCLVQKFRNSSVMLEAPLFRPKIFQTGDGPLAGQEETFPPPDNHSKMRRSLENAEHVGLFAPRVGQRFRDEQRRRRSRYDRGTRLAEIDEFSHEDHPQSQLVAANFPPRSASYTAYQRGPQNMY